MQTSSGAHITVLGDVVQKVHRPGTDPSELAARPARPGSARTGRAVCWRHWSPSRSASTSEAQVDEDWDAFLEPFARAAGGGGGGAWTNRFSS
ncbi:MAG: hypothetical protein JWR37_5060 [Mycobacterium sp.]|nr:hypothetical protein [Mycobacterium sp.]